MAAVEVDACVLAWPFSCLVTVTCSDHNEAHLLVLGPSDMMLFGVVSITGRPLAVGLFVCNVSDLLVDL